jgi:hypothetical protein
MAINLNKIPKWTLLAISGLLIVLALFYVVCDRPSLVHKIDVWQGQYEAERKFNDANTAIHLQVIDDQQEQIAELMGAVDSSNTVIANLEAGKDQAEADLADARKGWTELSADAQAKLRALDQAWTVKFNLLQAQDVEKDKIIFSLTESYNSQVIISGEYKAMWESEKALRINCELGLGLKDKRINQLERTNKLKNILGVAGWGVAAVVSLTK